MEVANIKAFFCYLTSGANGSDRMGGIGGSGEDEGSACADGLTPVWNWNVPDGVRSSEVEGSRLKRSVIPW